MVLPTVEQHDVAHVLVLEDAPHAAGRRVGVVALLVDALLGVGRVEAHDDVVELGQRACRWPQVDPTAADDACLLGIDQLAEQLLTPNFCSLILGQLVEEDVGQVGLVVVRRAAHDDAPLLGRRELAHDLDGSRRRRPEQARVLAEAQAELKHVERVRRVLAPRRQLVAIVDEDAVGEVLRLAVDLQAVHLLARL